MDVRVQVERLDWSPALDRPVEILGKVAGKLLPQGTVKDILHGTWLGHPLHPLLTDLPIGCWTNAMLLDIVGGRRGQPAADLLVGAGVLLALPTAASGLADWSELERPAARTGVVHAAANVIGLGLYSASWVARRRGRRAQGVALSFLGAAAATVGGFLGGHLAYRRGAGVSRNAFEPPSTDWAVVMDDTELAERTPVRVDVEGVDVLLYRDGDRIHAVSAVCSHVGGPLDEGEIGDGDQPTVTCPWHGSTFRLTDGVAVRGPAQAPVPTFDAQVTSGKVQVRRRA